MSGHYGLCWVVNLKNTSGDRWGLRRQKFYIIVHYKSVRRYTDADSLAHAPLDPPQNDNLDEDTFLGVVKADDFAEQQRCDPELRNLAEYYEGENVVVPKVFTQRLASFCLRNGILLNNNYSPVRANHIFRHSLGTAARRHARPA